MGGNVNVECHRDIGTIFKINLKTINEMTTEKAASINNKLSDSNINESSWWSKGKLSQIISTKEQMEYSAISSVCDPKDKTLTCNFSLTDIQSTSKENSSYKVRTPSAY